VEVTQLRTKLDALEKRKRQLENSNDDLESQVRALQAAVEIGKEKNEKLVEEKVFVCHELEGESGLVSSLGM